MVRFLVVFLFLFVAEISAAHDLKYFVSRALSESEAVKSAMWMRKASNYMYKEVKGALFPKLWFQSDAIRSNNPPFVWMSKMSRADVTPDMMNLKGFNDPDAVTNFSSSINLTYPLFYGGAIKSVVGANKALSRAADRLYAGSKERIAFEVAKTYLKVCWLKSRVRAAEEFVKSAKYHLRQAESRYRTGMALKSDVLKAKVYLAQTKERLVREETSLDVARRKLSMLSGGSAMEPAVVDVDLEDLFRELKGYGEDREKAVEVALRNRKDLSAYKLKVEAKEKQVDAARADYFPKVDLVSSFRWYGHNYPLQGEQSDWMIGGILRLNLFDGFARENRIKRAKAERLEAEFNYLRKRKEVALEVISAVERLKEARSRVEIAVNTVEEAKESLRIMEKRYQQGLATMTQLTDTQSYLEEAKAMYLGAIHDFLLAVYSVEYAKGTLLEFLGVGGGKR